MQAASALHYEAALTDRLVAVAELLSDDPTVTSHQDATTLLDILLRAVYDSPTAERLWLLFAAVTATMPTADQVMYGMRLLRLYPAQETMLWLLDQGYNTRRHEDAKLRLRVVSDCVITDVDHCARQDLHTGIQQVVRRTLPIWSERRLVPVVWTEPRRIFRELTEEESCRVLRWGSEPVTASSDQQPPVLIVPWRTVVVLAETPPLEACDRLAALARFSGNRLVAIGYDCIPAISADLVAPDEPNRFARYLTVIKHARRVAAISESAKVEFGGFADALIAQGITGPEVIECALPAASVDVAEGATDLEPSSEPQTSVPTVLSVGSFEPRKNQLALLYASERLWREGLEFGLVFITGSAWDARTRQIISALQTEGRSITIRVGVSDEELAQAYMAAAFTVFPSLHEGYGLPVAESLSLGTPVITTNFGSTREIGSAGGAVLIDPRDDETLIAAMRTLLTDNSALAALRQQIASRPSRSWREYADELWENLVMPELTSLAKNGL